MYSAGVLLQRSYPLPARFTRSERQRRNCDRIQQH